MTNGRSKAQNTQFFRYSMLGSITASWCRFHFADLDKYAKITEEEKTILYEVASRLRELEAIWRNNSQRLIDEDKKKKEQ